MQPRLVRIVPATVAALLFAAFSVAPAAAGTPVSTTLNPTPPDTYTCVPNGDGTVCRALTSDPYGPVPTGIECDSTTGPFEVMDQAVHVVDATRWYDRDGNLVKRVRDHRFLDARLSHPTNGLWVAYRQHDIDTDLLTVPGDLDSAAFRSVGSMVATVPGMGAVVVEKGRVEVGSDGTLEKSTGRRDFSQYFGGDPSVLAGLCAALAG
jgi:hypothetical protein